MHPLLQVGAAREERVMKRAEGCVHVASPKSTEEKEQQQKFSV